MDSGLYRLEGQIQNYVWGGHEFIPSLLGFPPEPHTPYAEYWLGAHKKAPSEVILNEHDRVPLDRLIEECPQRVLGPDVAQKHGRLPYLFKVLDVEEPLSIQVHPTKEQAEGGFARENELGIPLDSPRRNYRDDNHKPELMVALSDFWLLHGFLPEAKLDNVLREVPEFRGLGSAFENGGTAELYRHVMTLPTAEVDAILGPLVNRVRRQGERDGWEKSSPEYWVAQTAAEGITGGYDRGLFSIFFFNLVLLGTGQGIFQDAGIPHAYLQGQNIEVMANSDNVLRGGLTAKHVDVPELLRTISFERVLPAVLEGIQIDSSHEYVYEAPCDDFRLGRIELGKTEWYVHSAKSSEILLVTVGTADVVGGGRRHLSLSRGQSAVIFGGTDYRIGAGAKEVVLYRVSLP